MRIRHAAVAAMVAVGLSGAVAAQHKTAKPESAFVKMIKQMDKNGDGKLSREEYYAGFKDPKAAEEMFKKWDYNKDGFLSEADYRLQPAKTK